jgi:DNA-binding transcriptional LysR family regulator
VADAGSISAAVERVFLSQSSISEQLKKLEQQAGQLLLVRGKKGSTPTPAGVRLLEHARKILSLSEAAFDDLRGHALDGELRLALSDYFRPRDIAVVLKRFVQAHPRLRLHVTTLQSAAIEERAGLDEFDIGLAMRLVDEHGGHVAGYEPDVPGVVLRRERLLWVLAKEEPPEPAATMPLVTLPASCALQRYMLALFERHKMSYVVAHSASGVAGLQLALAAGLGVSCLNQSALCPELTECPAEWGLPPLPQAEFRLLPPRPGEAPLVGDARAALARLFG